MRGLYFPLRTIPEFTDGQNTALRRLLVAAEQAHAIPYVRYTIAATQAVANSTPEDLEWTAESAVFLRSDFPALTLPRLTVPVHRPGLWLCMASATLNETGSGTGQRQMRLFHVDGSTGTRTEIDEDTDHMSVATSEDSARNVLGIVPMAVGDAFAAEYEHSAGGSRNLVKGRIMLAGLAVR